MMKVKSRVLKVGNGTRRRQKGLNLIKLILYYTLIRENLLGQAKRESTI